MACFTVDCLHRALLTIMTTAWVGRPLVSIL